MALIGGVLAILVTVALTWFVLSWVCALCTRTDAQLGLHVDCLLQVGTGFQEAVFTGAFLSMSSTAVVLKAINIAQPWCPDRCGVWQCIEDGKLDESASSQATTSGLCCE